MALFWALRCLFTNYSGKVVSKLFVGLRYLLFLFHVVFLSFSDISASEMPASETLPSGAFSSDSLSSDLFSREIQLIINSLKYIHGVKNSASSTPITIVVIYDPESQRSLEEAHAFVAAAADQEAVWLPLMLPVEAVVSLQGFQGYQLAYITRDMEAYYQRIFELSKRNKVFTLSRDEACVRGDCCILSVSLKSGLDILLNESALKEVGYEVDAAFRFMVRRV